MTDGTAADDSFNEEAERIMRVCSIAIGLEASRVGIPVNTYATHLLPMQASLLQDLVQGLGVGTHTIDVFSDAPGEPLRVTATTDGSPDSPRQYLDLASVLLLAAHAPHHSAGITARTVRDGRVSVRGWSVLDGVPLPLSADVVRTMCLLGASAEGPQLPLNGVDYVDAFGLAE